MHIYNKKNDQNQFYTESGKLNTGTIYIWIGSKSHFLAPQNMTIMIMIILTVIKLIIIM